MSAASVLPLCPWHAPVLRSLARAAAEARLGHAWLLHGPPGVGKGRLAQTLAQALIAGLPPASWPDAIAHDATPRSLDEVPGDAADLHRVVPQDDRRSIGVDRIREVIEAVALTSHGGGARAVIVEPAEWMTVNAANSLLKTLEEPPPEVYLLLVSHQPGRLPATVRSRCQRLAVPRPPFDEALAWLENGQARADWPLALQLCEGRPVAAWRAGAEGLAETDRQRCERLAELLERRGDPLSVADDWVGKREGAPEALAWLQLRLERVLRDLYGSGAEPPHEPYARLLRAAGTLEPAAVFRLRDQVQRLGRLSDGGVNLVLGLEAAMIEAVAGGRR